MMSETGMLYNSDFTHKGMLEKTREVLKAHGESRKAAAHIFPWQDTTSQYIGGRTITGCASWTESRAQGKMKLILWLILSNFSRWKMVPSSPFHLLQARAGESHSLKGELRCNSNISVPFLHSSSTLAGVATAFLIKHTWRFIILILKLSGSLHGLLTPWNTYPWLRRSVLLIFRWNTFQSYLVYAIR